MDYLNDITAQLLALTPEVLLGAVIIATGYLLKKIQVFPNKYIPLACVILGSITYPFITDPGKAPPNIRYPAVREMMLGLLIGFLAWIFHNKILRKLEDKIPWLKGVFSNGDTEQIEHNGADHKP